jgi:hypothetical protein
MEVSMRPAIIGTLIGGLIVGALAGFLWWGNAARRMRADLQELQGQRAAAEVAREQLKGAETRLQKAEEELRSERERRSRLELIVSEGRK